MGGLHRRYTAAAEPRRIVPVVRRPIRAIEPYDSRATFRLRLNRSGRILTDCDLAPRMEFLPWTNECEPTCRIPVEAQIVGRMQKEKFCASAAGDALSAQARANHGGFIEHQEIAGT